MILKNIPDKVRCDLSVVDTEEDVPERGFISSTHGNVSIRFRIDFILLLQSQRPPWRKGAKLAALVDERPLFDEIVGGSESR